MVAKRSVKQLNVAGVTVGADELVVTYDDTSTALFVKHSGGSLVGKMMKINENQYQAAQKYFSPTTVVLALS